MLITIFNDNTGQILRALSIPDDDLLSNIQEGEDYLLGIYPNDIFFVDIETLQPVLFPTRPDPEYTFNYTTKEWEDLRPLSVVRDQQWAYIKSMREADNQVPLLTSHGTFDADTKSQKGITDAIMLLQTLQSLGTPTTIDFTLADNSTTTLTTAQMVEVGLALGARTQQLFAKARALRELINNASTKEDILAVTW